MSSNAVAGECIGFNSRNNECKVQHTQRDLPETLRGELCHVYKTISVRISKNYTEWFKNDPHEALTT
uniref:Uncharacterized protein n=1 Tax=Romanomermis culicivorax TaxID=13658 RepID=A0A915KN42_ROMCU